MTAIEERPLLVVVSAPSGAGKTTLCRMLLAGRDDLKYSVSCTTRSPRAGEVDGQSYHFLDESRFEHRVAAGDFLECARVHGAMYGTLRSTVEDILLAGDDVIMDIDVQGAEQIRRKVADLPADDPIRRGYVDIFVAPPSVDDLRSRLIGRAKDSEEVIERRVAQAAAEMAEMGRYMYCVVNDELEAAAHALESILTAEHHRMPGVYFAAAPSAE